MVSDGSSRTDRPHKKQKEKDDIISKLPDSLITHILNCLPTKDAVRTSVLSKRWIDCWTFITKLNFDDRVFYSRKRKKKSGGKQKFINFVNRVLHLTKSYSIQSVSLVVTNEYDVSLLNTWISCIFKKPVKVISISSNLELRLSDFTTGTLFNHTYNLEELVLEMCDCAIKVPSNRTSRYLIFGSLKVLKFCGIVFTIDNSQSIIFSVLKKFETRNCSWLSAHDVTLKIDAPLLESVYIEQDHESVTREPRRCTITFSIPCLKEFTYRGDGISQAITLANPALARNAAANIILRTGGNIVQETGSCVCLLLKQFSQVKCIKFDGSEILTQPNVAVLPKFAMLSHLELGSVSAEVLLGLLQKSPVLNTLIFKGISKFDQELLNSAVVPHCLASTLQVVKFGNVRGLEHELFLAKFFMENGVVLERISFSIEYCRSLSLVHRRPQREELIEEFKEKLYSFKKGVSFAILEFRY